MIFFVILVLSFILRLILTPTGFHVDIYSNAGWGEWISLHGPMGFYENRIWLYSWPTQPPFVSLIYGFDHSLYLFLLQTFRDLCNTIVKYHLAPGHMLWFFNFTIWFDKAKISQESAFTTGYLATIKLLPILADLGIASLLYFLSRQVKTIKVWLLPAIYLISPFSWYLSSLWGQYDQLSYLPVLLAFILESRKKLPVLTPFLFAFSIAVKPTSLIVLPLFIFLYFKNSHKKRELIISLILIAVFFWETTGVFTTKNPIAYISVLNERIFHKAASRLSANAFNFWRVFQKTSSDPHDVQFLFLPAYIWSYLALILFNFLAFRNIKTINYKNIFLSIFIVSSGCFLFMTDMLDRYFFISIVTGLILCLFNRKILKYWIILSLIFWINLYNQWWFPSFLEPLYKLFTWQNGLVTKALSLINVALFIKIWQISLQQPESTKSH